MLVRDLQFHFPQALYLLLGLIPLALLLFSLFYYRRRHTHAFAPSSILPSLLMPRSSSISLFKIFALLSIWLLASLALMDPRGNFQYLSSPQTALMHTMANRAPSQEVIFIVDTSASMSVQDSPEGRSRLEEAKTIVDETIQQLQGPYIALNAFTSVLTPLVPPTLDYLFTRILVQDLTINAGEVGGTSFGKMLDQLQNQVSSPSRRYTMILLSDGGDNQIESLTGSEHQVAIQAIVNRLSNFQNAEVRFFTIGMGTLKPSITPNATFEGHPVESKLEPAILEALAHQSGGRYYAAYENSPWLLAQDLVQQIRQQQSYPPVIPRLDRRVSLPKEVELAYHLYYQIPLGLGLVLLLAYILLPNARRLR